MIDTGNTAWLLLCAAMVFFMTPGLAFFYGGMSRSKNVLSTIMQSFFIIGLIGVEWLILGYSLAFSGDLGGIIGDFGKVGLQGVLGQVMDPGIPEMAFVAFQCMFAIITPALISGALVGRIRFGAYVVFSLIWSTILYNVMAHMVWGGGLLASLGALDFAGGLVIHILSGVSALTLCLLLGRRSGYGKRPMTPHHMPMVVLGAAILWFGWFGFNAGSALGANELAAIAFVNTQVAAAMGLVGWALVEWFHHGKPTVLGAASGAVSGLVAITPAAGFVTPIASLIMGLLGAAICYVSVVFVKNKLGYDDSLDAFGIHGVGGMWGAIATGLFATTNVNEAGADGLFYGDAHLLLVQILSVVVAIVIAVVGTYIIYRGLSLCMKVRVSAKEEMAGLDISQHGESAYNESDFKGGAFSLSDSSTWH